MTSEWSQIACDAVAKQRYRAKREDELTVDRGEELLLFAKRKNYYKAFLADDKSRWGVVPGSHIHITFEHEELDIEVPQGGIKAIPKKNINTKESNSMASPMQAKTGGGGKKKSIPVILESDSDDSSEEDAKIAAKFLEEKKAEKKKKAPMDDFDDIVNSLADSEPVKDTKLEKKKTADGEKKKTALKAKATDELHSLLEELGEEDEQDEEDELPPPPPRSSSEEEIPKKKKKPMVVIAAKKASDAGGEECSACGSENRVGYKACSQCGKPAGKSTAAKKTAKKVPKTPLVVEESESSESSELDLPPPPPPAPLSSDSESSEEIPVKAPKPVKSVKSTPVKKPVSVAKAPAPKKTLSPRKVISPKSARGPSELERKLGAKEACGGCGEDNKMGFKVCEGCGMPNKRK